MRDIQGTQVDPFFNINTQDDLAAARSLLANSIEG
jgi:molybdopterin-guanine dinucleotide biosynthesis protein A